MKLTRRASGNQLRYLAKEYRKLYGEECICAVPLPVVEALIELMDATLVAVREGDMRFYNLLALNQIEDEQVRIQPLRMALWELGEYESELTPKDDSP